MTIAINTDIDDWRWLMPIDDADHWCFWIMDDGWLTKTNGSWWVKTFWFLIELVHLGSVEARMPGKLSRFGFLIIMIGDDLWLRARMIDWCRWFTL
jgi:hypothetical protein